MNNTSALHCMYPHLTTILYTRQIPGAYGEVLQIVSLHIEVVVIISVVVKMRSIILKVIQNGHNSTLLVVRIQRLKADVLQSNAAV